MIEFFTLFLGLITGPQPVTVAVGPEVATVAFLVDDDRSGEAAGAPWTATVDFGSRLLPRELTAVAHDAQGGELGRTRQLINLPRPPAEVSMALETGTDRKSVV